MNTLTTFFEWLVAASLRASALTLAVWIVQFILQKHLSPRWRYALWLPVLIVLLMPVLPESRWSLGSVLREKPQVMEVAPTPVITPVAYSDAPLISAVPGTVSAPIDWQQIRLLTWTSGAALLLLISGFSFIRALRRFQRTCQSADAETLAQLERVAREVGLRNPPRLLVAPTINSPAVTGLLRPVLLLPAGFERDFSAEEARLILQHELTHLKRHDLPMNTLLCVLMSLHWFNPLLWLAFFMARADREAACDAQVLEGATPQRRSEYGHTLLKIESALSPQQLSLGFVGMLQRGAALRARIRSIATPTRTRPVSGALATLCLACMTFLGVTRAEKSSDGEKMEPLIAIEIKIVQFNQATDWNFGGRLSSGKTDSKSDPFTSEALGQSELTKLMRELALRKDLTLTSYPRMVTPNGKEVIIRSLVHQPFEEAKGKIAYMPLGLVMKLVPTFENGKLTMPTHITDSKIVKQEPLVVSSRVFQNTLGGDQGTSHVIVTWEEGKAQSLQPVLYIITPSRFHPDKAEHSIFLASKADKLRQASPERYKFNKAALGDVVRLLATDAGLRLMSLPDNDPISLRLITFEIRASPFQVLETICKANGLTLLPDRDIWYIRASNDPALVGRNYALPKTDVAHEIILKDIISILGISDTTAESTGSTGPSAAFKSGQNSLYINATRLQHTWVSGYLEGLGKKR